LDLEVEKRFEVAMYYRLLLRDTLFKDSSEAANIVEQEVRGFVRSRLELLMGLGQPQQDKQQVSEVFDQDEITALKAIAARVLRKPSLIQPSLKKQEAPPKALPSIRKRSGPQKPPVASKPPKPQKRKKTAETIDDIPDGTVVEEDGKKYQVATNDLGQKYKRDITGQVTPPGYVPPTKASIEAVLERSALQQLDKMDSLATHAAAGALAGLVGGDS
jgi:hypothetical protein